jgi:hypothetical protein
MEGKQKSGWQFWLPYFFAGIAAIGLSAYEYHTGQRPASRAEGVGGMKTVGESEISHTFLFGIVLSGMTLALMIWERVRKTRADGTLD